MGNKAATGRRITEHGHFADVRGDPGAPALLFLHGGPGQGCYDFMALQGDLLAASVPLSSRLAEHQHGVAGEPVLDVVVIPDDVWQGGPGMGARGGHS